MALAKDLEIRPANLSSAEREGVRARGLLALPRELVERFGLDEPLDAAARAALEQQIRDSHCGYAPEQQIGPMIDVQRAIDARMAESLLDARRGILIAGAGHANATAVTQLLERLVPRAEIAVVGFLEVDVEAPHATDYFERESPWDYLWFTPRVDSSDPCERFREQLQRLRGAS